MTDETLNPSETDADAQAKRASLEAEASRLEIKFDKRFSDKRLADMIADKKGEAAGVDARPPAPVVDVEKEAMMRELEQLRAERAAMTLANTRADGGAAQSVADELYKVPVGTMTSFQTSVSLEDAERAALMEQATRLGIGNVIPKKAGNDWIKEHISRHLTAKAQEQAILEAQAERARNQAPEHLVDIRILPAGNEKISRGVHIPGVGDLTHKRGEIVKGVAYSIAKAQEDNGYVEILDAVV